MKATLADEFLEDFGLEDEEEEENPVEEESNNAMDEDEVILRQEVPSSLPPWVSYHRKVSEDMLKYDSVRKITSLRTSGRIESLLQEVEDRIIASSQSKLF